MTCRGCQRDIDDSAPFCSLCGSDPLLGEPWLETIGHTGEGEEPFATEDASDEEVLRALALSAFRCAHRLYEAEASVAQVLEEADMYDSDTSRAQLARVYELVLQNVEEFQTACDDIASSASQRVPPEGFSERFPQIAWLWEGEYAPYLQARSPMEAADYLVRRARRRLGLLGGSAAAVWASPGGGYSIPYNANLLTTLPGEVGAFMPGMENIPTGPYCEFGRLEVALVPAAWRFWADFTSAPNAFALAYVDGDWPDFPLWGEDGPTEDFLYSARMRTLALERRFGVEVECDVSLVDGVALHPLRLLAPSGRVGARQSLRVEVPRRQSRVHARCRGRRSRGYLDAVMDLTARFEPACTEVV